MKKFFKTFSLIVLAIVIFGIVLFHKKILLCYGIAEKYISLQKNIEIGEPLNFQTSITSMNYKDVVYKKNNNIPITLDIYSPLKQVYKSSPVILYVHGGSWAYGNKEIPEVLSPVLDMLRNQGYTIISTSYELMKNTESFQTQISDVKDSIRWIYKNKDVYNFDTSEIGVIGISSGAHLSLMAGYTDNNTFKDDIELSEYPSKIKYIIDFFGPTDLSMLNTTNLNPDLSRIVSSISNTNELIKKYNPINYVNSKIPNTLIIHSKADEIVPYESSQKLYEKCIDVNAHAKLLSLNLGLHDFSGISSDDIVSLSKELLKFIVINSPY